MQTLMDFIDVKDFFPHGYCLLWSPLLLWLHVVSDLLITLSYYGIPLGLAYFLRQRKDFPYPRLVTMFAAFIVACGTTHLLSAITVWVPLYWLEGYLKALTALISLATALLMIWVIPLAIKLPSPSQLQAEIEQRKRVNKARQEALDHLQTIASRVPGMVFQFRLHADGRTCVPYSNKGMSELFRLSSEQVHEDASAIFALIHADDKPRVLQSIHQSAENLSPWVCEYRVQFDDGTVRWLSGNAVPQSEEDGSTLWHGFITDVTETKQKEIEYQAIIQTSFSGFFSNDFSGRLLSVNDALCRMLGYTEQELLNLSIAEIEAVETPDHIQAVIRSGHDRFETRLRHKNGVVIEVEINVQYVAALGPRFFVFVNDITDRKHAQQRLEQSEAQFRNTFEHAPIGVVNVALDGQFLAVNETLCRFLGFTREELLGMNIMDLSQDKDKAVYGQLINDLLTGEGEDFCIEKQCVCKEGRLLWGCICMRLGRKADGSPDYFIATVENIEERKKVQSEILATKNQLQATLGAIPDLLFELDLEGHYYDYHAHSSEHLTAPPEPLIGRNIADVLPAEATAVVMSALQEANENAYSNGMQFELAMQDGDYWFELSVAKKKTEIPDTQPHFILLSRDITERKRAEAELRASEQKFRLLVEQIPLALGLVSGSGKLLLINERFTQLLGYTLEDLSTIDGWWVLAYPDEVYRREVKGAWFRAVEYAVKHGTDIGPNEYRVTCKSGAERIMLISGILFENSLLATFVDITEPKQAETELRIAATVFEAQEGMMITDANKIILKVNHAFTRLTGYEPVAVIGQTPRLLRSDRHDNDFYAAMWQSITGHGVWQGEIWNRHKDGQVCPEWLTITAVKGHDGHVTHYVATFTDISERKATEEYINQLAFYDPLTQLPNRRLLSDRMKNGMERNRRAGSQMAVLMLDLDKFKPVNDSLGHAAGDELLKQVASRIKFRLREADTVARLGGDEFVILINDVSHYEDIARISNDIIQALARPFTVCEKHEVYIGASIGISIHPQHGDAAEVLIDNADTALYQAKNQGGGCFAYFSETLTQQAQELIALEERLRTAIERHELCVYFQPQIDMASSRLIGAEALVRWYDPVTGPLMPEDFIELAEQTGLIIEIGEWVLRETCKQGKLWLDQGLRPITLSVNVSPHQFRRCDMNALVQDVLQATSYPGQSLTLETNEGSLTENQETVIANFNKLHAQGVSIAIDNFGTGYVSLSYLKSFPLDLLKIDKTFISDIPESESDMAITGTIIAMAHNLGFKVLAEGVETQAQLDFLKEQGCDQYQGFLFNEALSADEFSGLLAEA